MKLSEELALRGFIHQFSTETLAEVFDGEKRTIYHGIDPSADSAHAGNFVNWMLLKHLAAAGHKVVFLVGGGTGMIGDPKPDVERPLSAPEEVAARVIKIKAQAQRLLGSEIAFVNNDDWLCELGLISFLRDIGKYFTVNELIKKDAIATRLSSETGLSYTEFAYPLLQAYDFLMLYRSHGATVQVGGSDQWGNIIAGVDLIRRLERVTAYAVTVPLIVDKTTGKKFGKSEGNAVWLDAEKTPPYAFYQFWYNVADENVIDYLKLFTFLPLEQIDEITQTLLNNPGARAAQQILAHEITRFVHGEDVSIAVARASASLFGEVAIADLSADEQVVLLANAPVTAQISGVLLVEALVAAGLATSKREARTFIESGAIVVNGQKATQVEEVLTKEACGELVHIRRGKKQVSLIKLS
ncbi:tyrosine--tRNA ligase [Patescibacteria group bacterium]|nr:tyrosine--tRNA ligase [Patescibacteria group bacterium]